MAAVLQIGMGWFSEEPGGLNRYYAGLVRAIARAGVEVRGLVAAEPGLELPAGIASFARRSDALLARLGGLRRSVGAALRADPSSVVAAHFALYSSPVLDLIGERPFVFHFHGPWAHESQAEREPALAVGAKRALERWVYRRPDRFIVLSEAFRGLLVRDYRVPEARVSTVPGGVDVAGFAVAATRRAAREALGLPADRPLVLAVRRLVRRVGLENLIDAMVAVRARVPEALLLVAGRGPLASELGERARERGLQDHVRLVGFVADSDLPLWYRAADLSVMPSVALEGFGLAAIESLAAGTPVLVTPVGGLPETVAGLDAGLVMPGHDTASLAGSIAAALQHPGALPGAEACQRHARENFDWAVIARQVLGVYGVEPPRTLRAVA